MNEYRYANAGPTWPHAYLWPALAKEIDLLPRDALAAGGVFDLGCGNGATAGMLAARGLTVTGVDSSQSGVALARRAYPDCRFDVASAYDNLAAVYGSFPLIISLEVVEHLYDPRLFARRLFDLTAQGGTAIVSTPYHGYLKNIALAVSGRLDAHFTVLWDGGHIKFFSIATLTALLSEVGFADIRFRRVGRVPVFAKSMMAVARRPR